MGLQATGVRHLGDLPSAFFDGKLVQGERSGLILDLQVPLIDPHRHVFPVQPPFTIKAPVLEFHEAVAINLASELRGVQGPGEHLFGKGPAQDPPENRCRAVASILARLVSIVFFCVVVHPPGPMRLLDLRPGARFGEGEADFAVFGWRTTSPRSSATAPQALSAPCEFRACHTVGVLGNCKIALHHQLLALRVRHSDGWLQQEPRENPTRFGWEKWPKPRQSC